MGSLREKEEMLRKAAEVLHTEPEQLHSVIQKFVQETDEMEDEIKKLKKTLK